MAKLVALLTNDPVEFKATEANKAPIAAAAGSEVVIFEVGEVNGSGADRRLKPGGKPRATATVAFATAIAAWIEAVEPGMAGLNGLGINIAAAALVKGVTPNLGEVPAGIAGMTAKSELLAPKGSRP